MIMMFFHIESGKVLNMRLLTQNIITELKNFFRKKLPTQKEEEQKSKERQYKKF